MDVKRSNDDDPETYLKNSMTYTYEGRPTAWIKIIPAIGVSKLVGFQSIEPAANSGINNVAR